MKRAFLLDEDIFLGGYIRRRGFKKCFYPDTRASGFSYQIIRKEDYGRILFFNKEEIIEAGLDQIPIGEGINNTI